MMFDWLDMDDDKAQEMRQQAITAYIDGEVSAETRSRFEAVMANDAALSAEVEAQRRIKALLAAAPEPTLPRNFLLPINAPQKQAQPAPQRAPQPTAVIKSPPWWQRWGAPALMLAVMVGMATIFMQGFGGSEPSIVEKEVIVTHIVEKEVIIVVEGEVITVTEIVEKEVVLEVTRSFGLAPTPNPNKAVILRQEVESLDPIDADSAETTQIIKNLFVRLVRKTSRYGIPLPDLATSWETETNNDGQTIWTFYLRDDVLWVRYDAAIEETLPWRNADNEQRFVTAQDVVFSVRRALAAELPIFQDMQVEIMDVVALDDQTVQFTLHDPRNKFLDKIATAWALAPIPAEVVAQWGANWTNPEYIVTSGAYVLVESRPSEQISVIQNRFWPQTDALFTERIDYFIRP